ncbi:MAG TPA: hypothetical protein VFO58_06095 [Vicinamibacterales bacterium]|nr:hypothetical protein [Vicinamibacterales bacterium]
MRTIRVALASIALLAGASPAFADATAFLGTASSPSNRLTRGFAVGFGLVIVGFEFEYGDTVEDPADSAPSLRTGMANVYLQTPGAIFGLQPYVTTGAGVYHESLGTASQTNFGLNSGGGVKISIAGPLRARIDYRVFSLRDSPLDPVHRFYVGVNLRF